MQLRAPKANGTNLLRNFRGVGLLLLLDDSSSHLPRVRLRVRVALDVPVLGVLLINDRFWSMIASKMADE